jgi:hypothetical protein
LGATVGSQISIYTCIKHEVVYFESAIIDGEDHVFINEHLMVVVMIIINYS